MQEIRDAGLPRTLVPRLTNAASEQLQSLQDLLAQVTYTDQPDRRLSPFIATDGKLDTASIYKLLKAQGQASDEKSNFIWKSAAPPRVQFFMWLKWIQCRSNLQKKGIVPHALCEVCNEADETPEHIINGCGITREFWAALGVVMPTGHDLSELHKLDWPSSIPQQYFETLVALACWQLWKRRNAVIFRNERPSLHQLWAQVEVR